LLFSSFGYSGSKYLFFHKFQNQVTFSFLQSVQCIFPQLDLFFKKPKYLCGVKFQFSTLKLHGNACIYTGIIKVRSDRHSEPNRVKDHCSFSSTHFNENKARGWNGRSPRSSSKKIRAVSWQLSNANHAGLPNPSTNSSAQSCATRKDASRGRAGGPSIPPQEGAPGTTLTGPAAANPTPICTSAASS